MGSEKEKFSIYNHRSSSHILRLPYSKSEAFLTASFSSVASPLPSSLHQKFSSSSSKFPSILQSVVILYSELYHKPMAGVSMLQSQRTRASPAFYKSDWKSSYLLMVPSEFLSIVAKFSSNLSSSNSPSGLTRWNIWTLNSLTSDFSSLLLPLVSI